MVTGAILLLSWSRDEKEPTGFSRDEPCRSSDGCLRRCPEQPVHEHGCASRGDTTCAPHSRWKTRPVRSVAACQRPGRNLGGGEPGGWHPGARAASSQAWRESSLPTLGRQESAGGL